MEDINMNPQIEALMQEYLADGSANNLQEAYILAMKNSGFTQSVGQIGGPATNAATAASAVGTASKAGGIRDWFSKYFNKLGSNQPLLKGNFKMPSFKGIREQQLFEGGPSIGGTARAGLGLYQGGKAVSGLIENSKKDADMTSLKNDINTAVASNPMYDMYLDASDEKTLRQMQNGGLTNAWGGAAEGAVKGIPQALLAALIGGVAGGPSGAAINGIGSLVNSGIRGYGNELDESSGKLQGLYSKLNQAESDYKTMKRPRGLGRAGLSTQYFNQLY